MESKKIVLVLGILLMFENAVIAGWIGTPCSSPCDCDDGLACHNGVCSVNCYAHSECSEANILGMSCQGHKFPSYCGSSNTCVRALLYKECYEWMVCPECDCSREVCWDGGDFFIDNLGNNELFCREADPLCFHLGTLYYHSFGTYVYLPDTENVYKCTFLHWRNPVCAEGYVWDSVKYPEGRWFNKPPSDGCIPKSCLDSDGDGVNITGGICGPIDCDDQNPDIYPSAAELCNGVDDNCNGLIDEDLIQVTVCGVGVCAGNTGQEYCSEGQWIGDTCDPFAGASEEILDGLDNDCNGLIDDGIDSDGDGILDDEDKCPDTTEEQIAYGCSCSQIQDLKPGNNKKHLDKTCNKGDIDVFKKGIGWARDLFN